MANLNAGDMAAMIEAAMQEEWQRANNGEPLPTAQGGQDRLVMFTALAKGVLRYLHENRMNIGTTVTRDQPPPGHSHTLEFGLDETPGP